MGIKEGEHCLSLAEGFVYSSFIRQIHPMKILWNSLFVLILSLLVYTQAFAQDYYFKNLGPFDPDVPTLQDFLTHPIGGRHTRHDQIVAYLEKLAEVSDRATISQYGWTHEGRKLMMLTISTPQNIKNLETIWGQHITYVQPYALSKNQSEWPKVDYDSLPVFIQLGYNVHGN